MDNQILGPCYTFEDGKIVPGIVVATQHNPQRISGPIDGVCIGRDKRVFIQLDYQTPPVVKDGLLMESAVNAIRADYIRLSGGLSTSPLDQPVIVKISTISERNVYTAGQILDTSGLRIALGTVQHYQYWCHEGLYQLRRGQTLRLVTSDGIERVLVCGLDKTTGEHIVPRIRAHTKEEWDNIVARVKTFFTRNND